jgi:hypothetical protein
MPVGVYPRRPSDPAERFWSKVEKTSTCWIWTAHRVAWGYGQFWYDARLIHAHRAAWILTHGPIPDGQLVLHRCDNPPCVRPDHLFLGSNDCNMADAVTKGRMQRGTQRPSAKLNDNTVKAIRRQYAAGEASLSQLAHAHDVTVSLIHGIVQRRRWKHIE